MSKSKKYKVAILGATGLVGQTVLRLLQGHAIFEVCQLSASARCIGQRFDDMCEWRHPCQKALVQNAHIKMVDASEITAPWVISCLPSHIAATIEPMLVQRGLYVFSNASCLRMDPSVPLVIPEINAFRQKMCAEQSGSGCLVKNPNCSVAGIALALAPLIVCGDGMDHISIVTLQSMSGAGYPGLSALDMADNTLPNIPGEWEKIGPEVQKILSTDERVFSVPMTTHVHRVPVTHGHVATVHILFKQSVDPHDVRHCYQQWNHRHPGLFVLHDQQDRPQARRDLLSDDMRVHIGQIRQGGHERMIGMTLLSHNLIRGAAGSVIANMESFLEKKIFDQKGNIL